MPSAMVVDVAETVPSFPDSRLGVAVLLALAVNLGVLLLPYPWTRGSSQSGGSVDVILVSGPERSASAPEPSGSGGGRAEAGSAGEPQVASRWEFAPGADALAPAGSPVTRGLGSRPSPRPSEAERARPAPRPSSPRRAEGARPARSIDRVAAPVGNRDDTPPRQSAVGPRADASPASAEPGRASEAGAGTGVPGGDPRGDAHAGGTSVDSDAVPIVRVPPSYPAAARAGRVEGRVLVEFTILSDGTVADPAVLEARPAGVFEQVVLRAIRQWRFAPRMHDGEPVSRRARQTVRFALTSY